MAARQRRRRRLVLAAIALVIVAYAVVRTFVLNDDVHRLTAGEALDRFRQQSTATVVSTGSEADVTLPAVGPALPTLPAPGVYLYRTYGQESIDAVGGSVHQYPDETTITVTTEACGVRLQWDVLKERRERWVLCVGDDGVHLQPDGGQSFHEFFGQTQTEDITCDRPVLLLPADGAPRAATHLTCLLGSLSWSPSWEVLERTVMEVAGTTMEVQHVRMTVADDDQYFEHITLDWYLDAHALPVSARLTKDSLSDTDFGDVEYVEHYAYDLQTLVPLR